MSNPFRNFLDRCAKGFTPAQKLGLGVAVLVYVLSPVDLLPFIPIDDLAVLAVYLKVLMSPTVRGPQVMAAVGGPPDAGVR